MVAIIINQEGRVENPRIVKSIGFGLDENAVRAVKGWTFKPATLEGEPVRVIVNVEVRYRIR